MKNMGSIPDYTYGITYIGRCYPLNGSQYLKGLVSTVACGEYLGSSKKNYNEKYTYIQ